MAQEKLTEDGKVIEIDLTQEQPKQKDWRETEKEIKQLLEIQYRGVKNWSKHYVNTLKCAYCGKFGRGITLRKEKTFGIYYCQDANCKGLLDTDLKNRQARATDKEMKEAKFRAVMGVER